MPKELCGIPVFWLLAAWAAGAATLNDVLAVRSDPSVIPWGRLAVMSVSSASASWIFWGMWRLRGTMRTQAALDLAMLVPHIVALMVAVLSGRERFTVRQWIAFGIFLASGYCIGS